MLKLGLGLDFLTTSGCRFISFFLAALCLTRCIVTITDTDTVKKQMELNSNLYHLASL